MSAAFDLTQNPFNLLGTSIRATREQLVEAHEVALTDGRAEEADLVRARQLVLTPRTRIDAELSWLPGSSPSQAREILSKLEQRDLAAAHELLANLQGLDKANLAADLCARSTGNTKFVVELLEAYRDISAADVLEILAGLRSVSGFPSPDKSQVNNSLANLKVAHAKAAIACVVTGDRPGKALTEIVEEFLSGDNEEVQHILDLIVREYDAWSESRLGAIKERIERDISAYRTNGGPIPVKQLEEELAAWDEISQPVQLVEESKGHEEPRSKEIYGIVRDFCLWLANENAHYAESLAISRALLETFPRLPSIAVQLSKDVGTLESLAEQAKVTKLMGPLLEAQGAAEKKFQVLDSDLMASGFGPKARGLAKSVYDAFSDVAARTVGTDLADMPWMVVRGLAIDLNNKHDSPEGACSLLEGLIAHKSTAPSKSVVDKLKADHRTLSRNVKWEELRKVSDETKRLSLISDLLNDADADERAGLLQLRAALEQRRTAATRKWLFWGLAAAGLVGFLIYDADKSQKQPPRSAPATTYAPSRPASSTTSTSSTSQSFDEQIPPPGNDRALNKSEVRYCVYQGERLEILRLLVSGNRSIDRFNGLIRDFNVSCSNFRYRQGDLQAVEAEVAGKREQLRSDVARILASWTPPPTAPAPAPVVAESLLDPAVVPEAMLIQTKLKALGYYGGVVDGIWGTGSRTSLKNYKAQNGLPADDKWDLTTQRRLMGR